MRQSERVSVLHQATSHCTVRLSPTTGLILTHFALCVLLFYTHKISFYDCFLRRYATNVSPSNLLTLKTWISILLFIWTSLQHETPTLDLRISLQAIAIEVIFNIMKKSIILSFKNSRIVLHMQQENVCVCVCVRSVLCIKVCEWNVCVVVEDNR